MTGRTYQEALKNAAKTMARVKHPRRLFKMITRFIVREVGLNFASILVYDSIKDHYVLVDSRGSKAIPAGFIRLDRHHPLIDWFIKKEPRLKLRKDYLHAVEVDDWLKNGALGTNEVLRKRVHSIQSSMKTLGALLCIPGCYRRELIGIMILGKKLNHQPYNTDEIAFFQTLALDASLTIKTAKFRDDLMERNLELEHKQKDLTEKLREIEHMRQREQETYYQIVLSLAHEVDAKDTYTSSHSAGVEKLGIMTAKELHYNLIDKHRADLLRASLRLHDVGKIGIPDAVLKKEAALTDEEWKIMRLHPEKGAKILEPLTSFKEVADIVLHHHENFDGTGYPDRLKGERIPLEARIIAVVDTFHAIVSSRCYRKGRPPEAAIQELEKGKGTQFDPAVVDAFICAYKKTRNRTRTLAFQK